MTGQQGTLASFGAKIAVSPARERKRSPVAQLLDRPALRAATPRHLPKDVPGDLLALASLVELFARPVHGLGPIRSQFQPNGWKGTGRSADELVARYNELDDALGALVARRTRAAAFVDAKSIAASPEVEAAWEAPAFGPHPSRLREISKRLAPSHLSLPQVALPQVPVHIRRAASALAATSVVTAALVFSGNSTGAVFAQAATVDRTSDTDASRSSNATTTTVAPTTTTTAVPVPPVTEAPTTTVPPTTAPPPPPPPPTWATPVPGARLSSSFGGRVNPVSHRYAQHAGVDYAAPYGTGIHVVADGVVTKAGWESGYGYMTCVKHSNSVVTCYAHQSKIRVSVGQSVTRDQVIGSVGNTGNSTGPHLHLEVRVNGKAVNPMNYL